MDSSCLVIVSILEGRNFEIPEECELTGDQYHLLMEAKFNEEVLMSDPIVLSASSPTVRPEIYTELAWQLSKRSLHQFRVDRKPIKLQCFLIRTETNEKTLIGYMVIDLRTAQESETPKHEWKPLLNTKYRGSHKTRPEIEVALQLTRCDPVEEESLEITEDGHGSVVIGSSKNPFCEPTKKNSHNLDGDRNGTDVKKVISIDDYEYDIQVKEVDGWFRIWDSRKSAPSNSINYNLSVVIVSADELPSIVSQFLPSENQSYHFKFTLLGKTILTKSFEVPSTLGPVDLPVEKITFKVAPSDLDILKKYFELNPSFTISFCSESLSMASVSIPLTNLYINPNGPSPVVGEFHLTPANTTTDQHDSQDFEAVIGVYVALEKISAGPSNKSHDAIVTISDSSLSSSPLTSPERSLINRSKLQNGITKDKISFNINRNNFKHANENSSPKQPPHQYCLTIDIRNIRSINPSFNWSKSSFLIQYSYAFFGPTTKIKTSEVNVTNDEIVNFENGFFTFNFVTSESQLRDTFENIALILELIEASVVPNKAIIRGISHVNLLDLIESEEKDHRKLLVTKPVITDYNDGKIAQLTVIFSLQDAGMYQNGNHFESQLSDPNSESDSLPCGVNSTTIFEAATGKTNQNLINSSLFNQIDHLFIEAALEIEAWKQAQVKLFKESIKKKEKKLTEHKIQELAILEMRLKQSLEKVALKEQLLDETRARVESEAAKRTSDEILKLRQELEQLKVVVEGKCRDIEKLESQNQQLRDKLPSVQSSSGLSSRAGSISRATGSKFRPSLLTDADTGTSKKKSDSKDFVLRSSAGFTRNNSLPSSVRTASKL